MQIDQEKVLESLRTDVVANKVLGICQRALLGNRYFEVKNVYLSGGRVVDHILGKKCSNDIDIFAIIAQRDINKNGIKDLNRKLVRELGVEAIEKQPKHNKSYGFLDHDPYASFFVYDFIGGLIHPKIQVVYYHTPNQLPQFDLKACEIFYDLNHVLGPGLNYFRIANDTLRVITISAVNRCIKYAGRGVEIHQNALSVIAEQLNSQHDTSLEQVSNSEDISEDMLRYIYTLLMYHPNYASNFSPKFLAALGASNLEPFNVICDSSLSALAS